jgi:3-hydroxyisobutyrate dehydrogenase-like beta-hydroxyacid dehydrogenase
LKNVGLIGVGVMGKLIVPRIRDAGHKLYIYDMSQDALLKVAGPGIDAAASPAEVASKVDIILQSSGLGKKDTSEMWKVRRERNTGN